MSVLLFEVRDHIAHITMNRPDVKNAYNHEMQLALQRAWEQVRDDSDIHLAILAGAGDAFSTGADMTTYFTPEVGDDVAQTRSFFSPFERPHKTFHNDLWEETFKPVIAAIAGPCRSGGFELALAADIRIAADTATFALAFVRAGLVGTASTVRLLRTVPNSMAMELILTGRTIDAAEAYRLGVVSRVVPAMRLLDVAEELAREILRNPPTAVWAAKELAIRGREVYLREAIRLGRQMLAARIRSEEAVRWRRDFAKGAHRYTGDSKRVARERGGFRDDVGDRGRGATDDDSGRGS